MKRLGVVLFIACFMPAVAMADACVEGKYYTDDYPSNCSRYSSSPAYCLGMVRNWGCTQCNSGYELTTFTNGYGDSRVGCKKICSECSGSNPSSGWQSAGEGYERSSSYRCNCGSWVLSSTSYRCAAGYYGVTSDGGSGCTKCPNGSVSSAGTESISGCCHASGEEFTDERGTGVFDGKCCYSE